MTAIWLLPFYPSPLKDDGYDIADYCDVHPQYGTLGDFKVFLREAHRRGLRVITELVLNHTSDQHPWFQRARRAEPGSRWRNFYVWSDTPDKYKDARIIFKDVETSNWTWDRVAKAYYWHRFFSHQPDLNFDNPEVHEAMIKVVDFWLDLGVDGLRLDAVPYLYEREGTNCENLPETHAFLKKLRAHVDEKYRDRMLLAEANQWPEDAVAYFGQGRGDECHMAFHFPLMPRLFMALRMEDRTAHRGHPGADAADSRDQPVGAVPAQPRRADAGNGHRRGARLHVSDVCARRIRRGSTWASAAAWRRCWATTASASNCSTRCCFRCPAPRCFITATKSAWAKTSISATATACARRCNGARTKTPASPAPIRRSLYLPINLDPEYHYEAVNVEVQLRNPHSLLWWMRRVLALRKRWRALGEGKCRISPAGKPQDSGLHPALRAGNPARGRQPVALPPAGRA